MSKINVRQAFLTPLITLSLLSLLSGCKELRDSPSTAIEDPEQVSFSIADSADALSSSSGDEYFTVTVSAVQGSYPIDDIFVLVQYGSAFYEMNVTANDANNNDVLDAGDTIIVGEGSVNLLGGSSVGSTIGVRIYQGQINGTLLGTGEWIPLN